ncbi:hypothetical protein FA95DRAFT_1581911 [Auriscalpium vulgare]|uniref:Uncharacterized protein n=1 Tax=Auriscalpium vulgare TaxID=40419 RepID=A0ACB8RYZ0_9AGAM|nr:hypothetical protein FA95DRAFT_1581911 [Auriscalpium vulgare]
MPGNPLLKRETSSSHNKSGKNGMENGTWPEDAILKHALYQYAAERLPLERRIGRLKDQYGLQIGLTTLKELNRHYEVPSSRRKLPQETARQLVLNKMADDPAGLRGAGTVMTKLAVDGTPVPRAIIRKVMRANDPDGAQARYPGKAPAIKRGRLTALGPMHEVNCDGHDKIGAQALQMGGVGLPIYGYKDKWSGCILHLVVIPNNRKADIVGHTFCDFVEKYGATALQITVDKGSETGDMYAMQTSLRSNYAQDVDCTAYPAFQALPSTRNIPIEGLWHWLRLNDGYNLHSFVTEGRKKGIFNGNDDLHVNLFNWIWPPIIQQRLDAFQIYWNTHTIRKQKDKLMPSNMSPNDAFISPQAYGGQRVSVAVPPATINALRSTLQLSREEAFRWVDDDFAQQAQQAYAHLGSPVLTVFSAWTVFSQMDGVLRQAMGRE